MYEFIDMIKWTANSLREFSSVGQELGCIQGNMVLKARTSTESYQTVIKINPVHTNIAIMSGKLASMNLAQGKSVSVTMKKILFLNLFITNCTSLEYITTSTSILFIHVFHNLK